MERVFGYMGCSMCPGPRRGRSPHGPAGHRRQRRLRADARLQGGPEHAEGPATRQNGSRFLKFNRLTSLLEGLKVILVAPFGC